VARQAFADDLAGFDVEGGEQRGRAVSLLWLPPVVQEFSDPISV